ALPTDLEFLARVYRSTRQDEMNAWGWNAAQQDAFARMQFQARRSSYTASFPEATESIILRGPASAGSMITNRTAKELRLVDIALLPEHRSCGIGGHLISRLVEEAGAAKVPLTLSVLRSNPAIRLYQRLGLKLRPGGDDIYLEMESNHG